MKPPLGAVGGAVAWGVIAIMRKRRTSKEK